ncbi:MAG: hypothetical protein CBC42_03200 [Betaproteobacteria bacterium TMED82]|nr:MAG: hypothetical protein CBC42_03200 [Betaproteobacteria bacterium TMED82]|tara:strand:- start:30581 stop:31159 length:579 start_codon:yes stop_codon:yes gene_type:complete
MNRAYKRFLPKKETILKNRFVKWLGPGLLHPQLWRFSRKGVALGVGIGIFFGFLIPLAQIPVSAISATVLRANVPTAIASTLITNPVTFAPIYVVAYKIGNNLLGERVNPSSLDKVSKGITPLDLPNEQVETNDDMGLFKNLLSVSKPLAVGLALFAVAGSLTTYFSILFFWWLWIKLKRRARKFKSVRRNV